MSTEKRIPVELTRGELMLLTEALDSHAYWQLSEDQYRRDGFVEEPGSDDPATAQTIKDTNALHDRFERLTLGSERARSAAKRAKKARTR